MRKLLATILLLAFAVASNGQDTVTSGGGRITATNRPGDDSVPMYLRGFTNAQGVIRYYWSEVVASNTNSQPPSATLTNLSNTRAITNIGNAFVGVITLDILYQPIVSLQTNLIVLNNATNLGPVLMSNSLTVLGLISISNHVDALTSNRFRIGSATATISNLYTVGTIYPALQGASEAVPTGFIRVVNSNNTIYAIKAAAMVNLEETGSGTAVYIDTAHTNITAKGLTIQNAEDREVVTLSGVEPIIDATNSPSYYIELSGNTVATISNLTVGRFVQLLVSNTTHTFSIAGAGMYINQNTTPSVTTNGYTTYEIWRPSTSVTNIRVFGRELELEALSGIAFVTNSTGTRLGISNTLSSASGDIIKVNENDVSDSGSFSNTTATATVPGITYSIVANAHPAPDIITHTISAVSGTVAGIVTAQAQTIGGLKTFPDDIRTDELQVNNIQVTNNLNVADTTTTDTLLAGTGGIGNLQTINVNVTNNITYRAPTLVLSGNSTQYAGNFDIAWNIIDLTNCFHLTGMVNVAAANLGKAWILTGRNLTSSNNVVSVSPSFQRAGTNFVTVPAAKRFRMSVFADGSGGVNETNMMADIQVYDSP